MVLDRFRGESSNQPFDDNSVPPAEELEPLLEDGEEPAYLLTTRRPVTVVREDDTEDETVDAPRGERLYMTVTTHSLHLQHKSTPFDPVMSLDLADVDSSEFRRDFMAPSIVLESDGESIRYPPYDNDAGESVADFVQRVGTAWADLHDALETARETVAAIESAEGADSAAVDRATDALSTAYDCSTRYDDAPTDQMKGEIAPVRADFEQHTVSPHLDQARNEVKKAKLNHDEHSIEAAFDSLVTAQSGLAAAHDALADLDAPSARIRIADLEDKVTTVSEDLRTDAEEACGRARAADTPDDAVSAWERAIEWYRAMLRTNAAPLLGVREAAIRYQTAWITGNIVRSLEDRAAEREAAAEAIDDTDEAQAQYENAKTDLERARDLAADLPAGDPSAIEDRIEAVDEEMELAAWEWGGE